MQSSTDKQYSKIRNRTVFFDHDGNPEDLIALILLLGMDNINLIGISITPADCYLQDAIKSNLKILSLFKKDIPVAGGTIFGRNPFPAEWRILTRKVNLFPAMLNIEENSNLLVKDAGHDFMIKKIKESKEKVTVLLTGPCTNLTAAIEKDPSIKDNIEEVVWMAGAVDVVGNVTQYHHNGSAEWNVYWDPLASRKLFETGLNITIFSLDSTNTVPVSTNFLKKVAAQNEYILSDLVGYLYSISYVETFNEVDAYYMWDTLCTSYLGCDNLATFRKEELEVIADTPEEGRTKKAPGTKQFINVAKDINVDIFYDYFLGQLRKLGKK